MFSAGSGERRLNWAEVSVDFIDQDPGTTMVLGISPPSQKCVLEK